MTLFVGMRLGKREMFLRKTLAYGLSGRKYAHMKTTIELDDEKLESIMRAMSFKTRKEAIDWALTEGERLAVMHSIRANPWSAEMLRDAVDADYDVLAVRRGVRTYKED